MLYEVFKAGILQKRTRKPSAKRRGWTAAAALCQNCREHIVVGSGG